MYDKKIVEHLFAVSKTLGKLDVVEISKAITLLRHTRRQDRAVFTMGNGGSASTASHFANDLLKMARIRTYCVSDMTPTTLAFGNDNGWQYMFADPLLDMIKPKDTVVLFSCSGNSQNIVLPMLLSFGVALTIVFTGDNGGQLRDELVNVKIKVPHPDIKVQEDVHLAVCHAIAGALSD
jgi:D-sedoheptulose 7-phosphate isomerase